MFKVIGKVGLLVVLLGVSVLGFAETPRLINYQGKLADADGAPVNGQQEVVFEIYANAVDGDAIWTETHQIEVQAGLFNVLLGSLNELTLPFDQQYFLEIKINNQTIGQRMQMASAAYAMRSIYADNGIPSNGMIMWSGYKTEVPEGWQLCDGQNDTPDLRHQFIVDRKKSKIYDFKHPAIDKWKNKHKKDKHKQDKPKKENIVYYKAAYIIKK